MKKHTEAQAKEKIQHYCAYQERSHLEVRNKLFTYGLYSSEVETLLTQLITDGFLSEERFAKAFAGGKFRIKKWGKLKIKNSLEAHYISKNCIKVGLNEITDDDYQKTLIDLLTKKSATLEEDAGYAKKDKLARYAIQKGYEPDLVWKYLKEISL